MLGAKTILQHFCLLKLQTDCPESPLIHFTLDLELIFGYSVFRKCCFPKVDKSTAFSYYMRPRPQFTKLLEGVAVCRMRGKDGKIYV